MSQYPECVKRALLVIEKEYRDPTLNLKKIANSASVDKYHLCRSFKDTLGQTIQQYLFEQRMAYLIKLHQENPRLTINLLIHKSSFRSYRSLSNYVKKHYQCTPLTSLNINDNK